MTARQDEVVGAIRRRILGGLHLGTLSQGDRLPSTRELAEEFQVTPRTIMSAYRELEREGWVELRPRSGIYVAAMHRAGGELLPQLAGWIVDVLVQGLSRNLAPIDFPEHVRRCLETLRLRAACIAPNLDQLHSLCSELQADYGLVTSAVELDAASAGDENALLALRRADLLVTTSFNAVEVQRLAQRLEKPWIIVALRPDLMSEVVRLLSAGPVYFVATDPRFVETLHDAFDSTGKVQNIRPVILGRDDPRAIPPGAPTYIMPRARAQLGESELTVRVIPAPRAFSTETARELLTFIVRANMAAAAVRAA